MMSGRKNAGKIAGLVIVLSGILLFLYPDIRTWLYEYQAGKEIGIYQKVNAPERIVTEEVIPDGWEDIQDTAGVSGTEEERNILTPTIVLREQIEAYNQRIYKEHQKDFRDAWSVTQPPQVLAGIGDEMFGYLEIPAMDVRMPLYIGASAQHLAKGAAVLGETSIPIGGANTNAAIAGHRGWRGVPYFREIEKISVGDEVYLTNPWETLVYRATGIRIITPDDSDAVKIQDGKDMITLITCHPYRSGGKYRYLVFCERCGTAALSDAAGTDGTILSAESTISETVQDESGLPVSSRSDLEREKLLRRSGILMILSMAAVMVIRSMSENKKKKGRERSQCK